MYKLSTRLCHSYGYISRQTYGWVYVPHKEHLEDSCMDKQAIPRQGYSSDHLDSSFQSLDNPIILTMLVPIRCKKIKL